jgi:hypothetical protein
VEGIYAYQVKRFYRSSIEKLRIRRKSWSVFRKISYPNRAPRWPTLLTPLSVYGPVPLIWSNRPLFLIQADSHKLSEARCASTGDTVDMTRDKPTPAPLLAIYLAPPTIIHRKREAKGKAASFSFSDPPKCEPHAAERSDAR